MVGLSETEWISNAIRCVVGSVAVGRLEEMENKSLALEVGRDIGPTSSARQSHSAD